MTDVAFQTSDRTAPIIIHVRVAGAGPGVSGAFALLNVSSTGRRTEISPTGQHGATAEWSIPAADVSSAPGGVDAFELNTRNISYYSGNVSLYAKATQNGAALKALDASGASITENSDGEVLLETLASGASATDAIGLILV